MHVGNAQIAFRYAHEMKVSEDICYENRMLSFP